MDIIFLGDSITQGVGSAKYEDCYVELVKRETGCRAINAGMGSTWISRSTTMWQEPHWPALDFNARAAALPDTCDICFVFGGTNDYGDGDNPVGDINDDGYYTFAGAVNNLIDSLSAKYGRERIVFITPCRRFFEDSHKATYSDKTVEPFPNFVNMLIKILEKKNVRYIDLYNDPEMPKPLSTSNEGCFVDGLHPNDKGHRHIADKVIEVVKSFEK